MPQHITDGANYRVRVSSTNPVVTGLTGSDVIVVHDAPAAQTITGAADVNTNTTTAYTYSVPAVAGSTWAWVMPAATITPAANSATMVFTTTGTGSFDESG